MTTLPDLLPYPAAQDLVRWVTAKRGFETGAALVDFLLWADVQSCQYQPEGETSSRGDRGRMPAVPAGRGGKAKVEIQERLL